MKYALLFRPESVKKVLSAGGVALAMLAVSACGGSGAAAPVVESSASAMATTTAVPTPTSAPTPTEAHNGIPVKGPAQNVNGKYIQTTLNPGDPIIATFDPKFVNGDAANTFTHDELREAVKVSQVFIAEEGLDSILNGSNDPVDVEAWWAANKDRYTPKLQPDAYNAAITGESIVVRNSWDKANVNNRQYWYDENATRIQIRENAINYVEVSSQWPNSVGVDTKLDYIIWGKDEAGNKIPINVKGNFYLNLRKDESTGGKWLIDGWNNKYEGFVSHK